MLNLVPAAAQTRSLAVVQNLFVAVEMPVSIAAVVVQGIAVEGSLFVVVGREQVVVGILFVGFGRVVGVVVKIERL